jgi:large subunit ribosomal protein L10
VQVEPEQYAFEPACARALFVRRPRKRLDEDCEEMKREQKEALVAELADELGAAEAIFAVDYRGISVPQAAELRAELRQADAAFRVVKNRLTIRAADAAGTEPIKEWLHGPTALALVRGDAALAAKTISRLGEEFDVLDYKGGLMDGALLEPDQFKAIAKLPGREQMNAQLAGIVASPITGLVRGLGSMVQGLAIQLSQIAEQGLVTGEAPTPAEDDPPEAPDGDSASPTPEDAPGGSAAEAEQPPDADSAEAEQPPDAESGEAGEAGGDDGEGADAPAGTAAEETTEPEATASDEETDKEDN